MPVVDEKFLRTLYTKEQFEDVLRFLKDEIQKRFPQWTAHADDDFGTVLLELFAGIVDMFRFYQNVTAVESFPCLARLRESLVRHAKWFAYIPKPPGAARTTLTFTVENPLHGAVVPRGTRVATADGSIVFETTEDLVIKPGEVSGTVGAIHAHLVRAELVGVSTGEKNQRFRLLQKPLVVLSSDEPSP
ncbi:MAG: baseplate J/gp47 family protein, partial [Candidatus Bipolaricaulaceae bacterium]